VPFRAFVVERHDDGTVSRSLTTLEPEQLHVGEVTIRVEWSSVNYKDALATIANGGVARVTPLVPGVDLAGTVVDSSDPDIAPGDRVLAHAYDLGVSRHGGFAELARVPAAWVVPLPDGLTARDAMAIGTAGFTSALSLERLEARGMQPDDGPVLVTGATGGVGSTAVAMLAARGYHVVGSTGKQEEHSYLRELGAAEVLDRSETIVSSGKVLERERWAGAVDCVGGATLAYVLRTLRYGAAVAASGNTGGRELNTTVFPFILRGVDLLGVDSVNTPIQRRREVWQRLATDLRPPHLEESIAREVELADVESVLDDIMQGQVRGRVVVRVSGEGS
jgi:acrylyl-CoA reductase (NADPH)